MLLSKTATGVLVCAVILAVTHAALSSPSDAGHSIKVFTNPRRSNDITIASDDKNNSPIIAYISAFFPEGKRAFPLDVYFDCNVTDAEGDTLTFFWNFGDGTNSTEKSPKKTYGRRGSYLVFAIVGDGHSSALSGIMVINVGDLPSVNITSPRNNTVVSGGQSILLNGSATSGDQPLAGDQLVWNAARVSNGIVIPIMVLKRGTSVILKIPTVGLGITGNVSYIVTLTATNNHSISSTAVVHLLPRVAELTLATTPSGIPLKLDFITHVTPYTANALAGYHHILSAQKFVCHHNRKHVFVGWSDGKKISHSIIVPTTAKTYTARYQVTGARCTVPVDIPSCLSGYGCGVYLPMNLCQCDQFCTVYNDCCPDAGQCP
jgi:hypothetical protein